MLKIINDNSKKTANEIHSRLRIFNRKNCKYFIEKAKDNRDEYEEKTQNFIVYDNDKLVGGAVGFVEYNWYFLDLLYIDEEYRSQTIGTKLIKQIEEYAKEEKLTGIRMETWDFQARGFYEKNGYKVFAEIKDCPPTTICYFLKKEINS